METLHLHRKYFTKKRHRVSMKKWSHQIRQVLWERVREHGLCYWEDLFGFRTAHDTRVSEVFLWHRDLCLSAAQGRRLPSTLDTDLGNDRGHFPHLGSLQAALGPQTRWNKTESSIQNQKSAKGLLWTVALPEKASVGEGTKPKKTKTDEGSRAKQPGNYPDFMAPLLLSAGEKKKNNRSSKQGWPKPLKYWCRNWTFLLEIWNWSHMELLC